MGTGWCAYTHELTDARGHQGNENLEPQRDCTRRGNLAVRENSRPPDDAKRRQPQSFAPTLRAYLGGTLQYTTCLSPILNMTNSHPQISPFSHASTRDLSCPVALW